VATEVHRAKVQIVLISHHFLERLKHEAAVKTRLSPINRVLRSKRVIAVLVHTTIDAIKNGYEAG